MKVMIVEDDQAVNVAYSTYFQLKGYTVLSCMDGDEALNMAGEFEPDIIMLDILMPYKNGIDFLKSYDLAKHPDTKVIIFTNSATPSNRDEAMKLGVHRFLSKAELTPSKMAEVVEELTGKTPAPPKVEPSSDK